MVLLFECPVCFEKLPQLKMLPCNHTFCLDCLNKMANIRVNIISCPLCRSQHKLPNIGYFEQIYSAEGFASNLTMMILIKQKSTLALEFIYYNVGNIYNSTIGFFMHYTKNHKCSNALYGCVWTGKFYEISNHFCEYQEENCRYCKGTFLRKNVHRHLHRRHANGLHLAAEKGELLL